MARAVSSLRLVHTVADLRAARARLAEPVGLVPTMGALHAGHASLLRHARLECAALVASVFVNPLQFGPDEDYQKYPRSLERDLALLDEAGADLVFAPSVAEVYPQPVECLVDPGPLARFFEGERRPGHLSGVATIVLKLFNIVAPHRAYFGKKDAQQLAVVKRMAVDLNVPVDVIGCETVREPDGLAISSRNEYLSANERREATRLYRALAHVAQRFLEADTESGGARDIGPILKEAEAMLQPLRLDYLAVVDPAKFEDISEMRPQGALIAIGAAFAGSTRLIDNVDVRAA